MNNFHIRTDVGTIHVSTICLDHMFGEGYETCLFGDDGSEVVEHYDTQEGAEAGHARWVSQVAGGRKVRY